MEQCNEIERNLSAELVDAASIFLPPQWSIENENMIYDGMQNLPENR